MVEIDEVLTETFGIQLLQMMENAGRALAIVSRALLGHSVYGVDVVALAGNGYNGGGVLVAARRLATWGAKVSVYTVGGDMKPETALQMKSLEAMGIAISEGAPQIDDVDLVLDGVLGYNIEGAPHGKAAELIGWANEADALAVSLDVPSGLDCTSGDAHEPTLEAAATVALGMPKVGLHDGGGHSFAGDIYIADISIPREVFGKLDVEVPELFVYTDICRWMPPNPGMVDALDAAEGASDTIAGKIPDALAEAIADGMAEGEGEDDGLTTGEDEAISDEDASSGDEDDSSGDEDANSGDEDAASEADGDSDAGDDADKDKD